MDSFQTWVSYTPSRYVELTKIWIRKSCKLQKVEICSLFVHFVMNLLDYFLQFSMYLYETQVSDAPQVYVELTERWITKSWELQKLEICTLSI
jgi:hypothetical protein